MSSNSFVEIRFLKEFLEISLGAKVIEYQLKFLTKPGDNYGSIIQSLEVKLTENDEKVKERVKYFQLNWPLRLISTLIR